MSLTTAQKESVKQWVAAGASLSEVQSRLAAEFKVEMTYLDTRLLLLDLAATIQDKKVEGAGKVEDVEGVEGVEDVEGGKRVEGAEGVEGGKSGEGAGAPVSRPAAPSAAAPAASSVSVTVDTLVVPGAIASGGVTFSDGVTAKWLLDQMGRLGLEDVSKPGYRPSPADAAAFQQQLVTTLQAKGLV